VTKPEDSIKNINSINFFQRDILTEVNVMDRGVSFLSKSSNLVGCIHIARSYYHVNIDDFERVKGII